MKFRGLILRLRGAEVARQPQPGEKTKTKARGGYFDGFEVPVRKTGRFHRAVKEKQGFVREIRSSNSGGGLIWGSASSEGCGGWARLFLFGASIFEGPLKNRRTRRGPSGGSSGGVARAFAIPAKASNPLHV